MYIDGKLKYEINTEGNTVNISISPAEPTMYRRNYYSPIGTQEEREELRIWPGKWVNVNGYLRWYYTGSHWAWHTGADLNLNEPKFDSDAHAPIYSIAEGEVYAVLALSGWGTVICIEHAEVLSRYAHVENVQVRQGQTVTSQTHLANIGNAGGNFPYHLHFDVAKLDSRMGRVPGDWPRENKTRVTSDYLDPEIFLKEHLYE